MFDVAILFYVLHFYINLCRAHLKSLAQYIQIAIKEIELDCL